MARRRSKANGEGSIYQRSSDGWWVAAIPVGRDSKGKIKRKYTYHQTRREAHESLTKALADKQNGLPSNPSQQTVGQFLTSWVEDTVKMTLRPRTYDSYSRIIRNHIVPSLGSIKLQKLSRQHLQHLYRVKKEEGYTRTLQLIHAVLHSALNKAVMWDLVPRNVVDVVSCPRVPRKEMKVLTVDQVKRFLEIAKDSHEYALYVLAVTCGLRQGELLALKWSDYDSQNGIIQIQRQLQWFGGDFQFSKPKTSKSRRAIVLPTLAKNALQHHKANQNKQRLLMGEEWYDHNLIFPTLKGTPVRQSNLIRRSFHPLLKKAGLPRIRFHDLRHTAATLLFQQGVHPKLVQELLGHSQIRQTLDCYSHVLQPMMKEVARQMDTIFEAANAGNRE